MKRTLKKSAMAAMLATTVSLGSGVGVAIASTAASIQQSVFGEVAKEAGIDPLLLYAVALTESALGKGAGTVSPHPYALRVASLPGAYPENREDAEKRLAELLRNHRSVDIGLMQVNLRWHGHRVESPYSLLDPETNLRVGAAILREAMDSTEDPYIGIGRYYTWSDDRASRRYGERVRHYYRQLKAAP